MYDCNSDMLETPFIDSYSSWFNNNYEDPASLFDMCNLYPVSDSGSLEKTAYQAQHERRSEYDCSYWLSEYDPCYGGYWGDYLFSGVWYSRDDDDDGCNDPMVKTKNCSQSEDRLFQGYNSYNYVFEDGFSQPDCDYNTWSCYKCCEEEDSYCYDGDEQGTTYGYCIDDVELCDGILGYFPCLLRMQNEYNKMQ